MSIALPLRPHERLSRGQENQPEEDEMHDRIVDIDHEKIPAIGRYRDEEKRNCNCAYAISDDQRKRSDEREEKNKTKRVRGHCRSKESNPRVPEQLANQLVIDQPVGAAEIGDLRVEMQEIHCTQ